MVKEYNFHKTSPETSITLLPSVTKMLHKEKIISTVSENIVALLF